MGARLPKKGTMSNHPIFEATTSPLYSSNDQRLRMWTAADVRPRAKYTVELDDQTIVLATNKSLIVDAFIAGYDLAERTLGELVRELGGRTA